VSLIEPISLVCPTFALGARGYELVLPGGAKLSGHIPDLWANQAEICSAILGKLEGALLPMKPVFDIIEVVLCIKDILAALPDPIAAADKLTGCIPKFENLLQLVPQFSMPQTICGAFDLLICILNGAATELSAIVMKAAAIDNLAAKSTGPQDPIFNFVECSNRLNQLRVCAVNESMGPLNSIIALLNIFLELLGLDPLPNLQEFGAELAAEIQKIQTFITILRTAKYAIGCMPNFPVPRCDTGNATAQSLQSIGNVIG
jgi:hypothetical protein